MSEYETERERQKQETPESQGKEKDKAGDLGDAHKPLQAHPERMFLS